MAVTYEKSLRQLQNTRDLRAEMLDLAARLAGNHQQGRLSVVDPAISRSTVEDEWHRLLPAIAADVRSRMTLRLEPINIAAEGKVGGYRIDSDILPLDRPNYRFEVLRQLLGTHLADENPGSVKGLMEMIGASQTPIRQALAVLKQAGIANSWGRSLEVDAEDLTMEQMAKVRALPQTLRFRFARGAQIKSPAALLERAMSLQVSSKSADWARLSLSGTPVAKALVPELDLMGVPRLDLIAHVPRADKSFNIRPLRQLDDGLELEPNVLAPAPVVITLVRADTVLERSVAGLGPSRCAYDMDVFLALLDIGLRGQALQYARAPRE